MSSEVREQADAANIESREVTIVGQHGSVVIAARLRERRGITEGTVVLQEEREGGVWIQPADVTHRPSPPTPERCAAPVLADLLARITPENMHEEVDFGPAVY